ncbi:MAG TPA: NAD(P)/FAD-dependent oxidoreductase, partial [Candidatus Lokiarchaeia archaeon]|nr:NAD(P)/FAD-dependent oxidoreductase [Candidatus Lokiarchaeia archaeon]
FSPDCKSCIEMQDPTQAGYIVNRLEFGQRLLDEASNAGDVEFRDETIAREFLFDGSTVCGIKARDKRNKETVDLEAKVTIDASGYHTPLRKTLQSPFIEQEINEKSDSIYCFREIVDFGDTADFDPDFISITLDQEKAPGGYIWHFPKSATALNVGLGTFPANAHELKQMYYKYAFQPIAEGKQFVVQTRGGGLVTVRRPIPSLVEDGIMFVGDAAAQVNPLHGGGIDSSMRAGWMAAKAATLAIEQGSMSKANLWSYNVEFMRSVGAQFAALDVLRTGLQSLPNEELNFGLKNNLLEAKDILSIAATGGVQLGIFDLAVRAVRGIWKPNLLATLAYINRKMGDVKTLYAKYPESTDGFGQWKDRVDQEFSGIHKILAPKRDLFTYETKKKTRNPVFWIV